jgi:hypothetical protein
MNELRFIQKYKERLAEMELSGVSCPKFEILPNSSHYVDMKLTYFNQLTERFCPPKCRNSARRLRGGLGKNKEAFLTNLIFLLSLLTREKSLGK